MRHSATIVLSAVLATSVLAAHPVVDNLTEHPVEELLAVENGTVESVSIDGQEGWRWRINAGQNSILAIRPEHPVYGRLRYYDRLRFDYRIASGEVSSIKLNAVGHVSGPRQYKVHNHRIAIATTLREVWHPTELNLADAYWFPWDSPDGEGEDGYFRFESLAIVPDTVVELRNVRLVRGLLYLKPDYERPVTWPTKTESEDGSVTYSLGYRVLNSSGRPADITAKIVSQHERFRVSLDKTSMSVKASKIASFTLTATMSKSDIERSEELYAEPLRVVFSLSHRPNVTTMWQGRLVRPLSKHVRRQVMLTEADLQLLRDKIKAGDEKIVRLIGYKQTIARADEFVGKTLQTVPQSYNHVRNGYPRPWMPGDIMSEAVNTKTGERQIGSHIAGAVWREYLAYSGQATYHTGLAYALTQDEKYATKAIELMRLYAQQYAQRSWYVLFDVPYFRGAPIQTSSRIASNSSYGSNWEFKWHCKMLSLIADSPSWTAEDRKLIYEGFVQPYAAELAKLNASISNQTDITNHNLLLLGLVFDDATMVWLATMRDCGVVSRLRDIDEDGFSSEGRPLNYHHAAADEYLPSVNHLENSGLAIDYGKERILEAIRMSYYRATLSGFVPNCGDCGRGQSVRSSHLADFLVGIAPEEKWLLDVGRGSTIAAKLQRYRLNARPERDRWKKLLSSDPHLFPHAGLAILRSGETVGSQVMVTLDYGRNVFHGAKDRNQITLTALGKVFTHGPGTLYNAGSGGIQYNRDSRFRSFNDGRVSLAHNVIVADQTSQRTSIGKLLAWSDRPDYQVAVSQVDGIYPGVSHIRAVVLTKGLIVMLDRVRSKDEHTYDLVYHNFGELSFGQGWLAAPLGAPLAKTGNYENLVEPKKLTGNGVFRATWDLTQQYAQWAKKIDASKLPPIHLAFWQLPVKDGEHYAGVTGLNNSNTRIMSDEAPTIIHRVRGKAVDLVTVLEPYRETPRVTEVNPHGAAGVSVALSGDLRVTASLDELIRRFRYTAEAAAPQ